MSQHVFKVHLKHFFDTFRDHCSPHDSGPWTSDVPDDDLDPGLTKKIASTGARGIVLADRIKISRQPDVYFTTCTRKTFDAAKFEHPKYLFWAIH